MVQKSGKLTSGSLSYVFLQGSNHHPRWLALGFLNHQQYPTCFVDDLSGFSLMFFLGHVWQQKMSRNRSMFCSIYSNVSTSWKKIGIICSNTHVGSMGLVYLPIWMVDVLMVNVYYSIRQIYHTWSLWDIDLSNINTFYCPSFLLITPGESLKNAQVLKWMWQIRMAAPRWDPNSIMCWNTRCAGYTPTLGPQNHETWRF